MRGAPVLVVLDTSVIVAAARSRRGASSLLIDWLDDGRFSTAISQKLALEYEKVLRRDVEGRFLSKDDVTRFIDFMLHKSLHVDPDYLLRPGLGDPDDDFILELAFAAGVNYLVTHNFRDFRSAPGYGVKVVTPGMFVHLLRGEP